MNGLKNKTTLLGYELQCLTIVSLLLPELFVIMPSILVLVPIWSNTSAGTGKLAILGPNRPEGPYVEVYMFPEVLCFQRHILIQIDSGCSLSNGPAVFYFILAVVNDHLSSVRAGLAGKRCRKLTSACLLLIQMEMN